MRIDLREFQKRAVETLLDELQEARNSLIRRGKRQAIVFSAPTGSGKTVMVAALVEAVLAGGEAAAAAGVQVNPRTTFLWISDAPELNEQSRRRIRQVIDGVPPIRFEVIENTFDQPLFDEGRIYFLNYQKLRAGGRLVSLGDTRATTIWETIAATQRARRGGLVVIMDEAHRGLGKTAHEQAAYLTLAGTFISGSDAATSRQVDSGREAFSGVDVVLGLSATPERFDDFLQASPDRHRRPVVVEPTDVRLSGLIKDRLVLYGLEQAEPPVMTLLGEAVAQTRRMEQDWRAYTIGINKPPVMPLLVIQVEDAVGGRSSATPLDIVVAQLATMWPELTSDSIAHCFGDETSLLMPNGWTLRRVDPNDIAGEASIRVVLFKTALNTGWNCPRAEVLMSFRRSDDPTPIAQLVGRMVRTPLAERVEGDEALNTTHLYLPRFNKARLVAVRNALVADGGDNVPIALQSEMVDLVLRPGGEAMHAALSWLPVMSVPPSRPLPDLRRVFALARLVQQESLAEKVVTDLSSKMCDVLDAALEALLKEDTGFTARVEARRNVRLSYLEVHDGDVEPRDDGPRAEVNPLDVEMAFRAAAALMGGEVAAAWLAKKYDPESDLVIPKLQYLELIRRPNVLQDLKTLASENFRTLSDTHKAAFAACPADTRAHFSAIQGAGRHIQEKRISLPTRVIFPVSNDDVQHSGHLFVRPGTEDEFCAKLNEWEAAVLAEERDSDRFRGFFRNLPRRDWAVSYAYELDGIKPGYPDFLVLRCSQGAEGIEVDILEPHRGEDSCAKAKGLARFAEAFSNEYGRVQMIRRMDDGRLLRLSLDNEAVRQHVLDAVESTQQLLDAYRKFGVQGS